MTKENKTLRSGDIVDFGSAFDALPGNIMLLKPDVPFYTILAINDELLQITGVERQDVVGKGVFEVFSENSAATSATGPANLKVSLQNVVEKKAPDKVAAVRLDISADVGKYEAKHWSSFSKPVLDEDGKIRYILLTFTDIPTQAITSVAQDTTTQVMASEKLKEKDSRFRKMVEQAPVAIAVFRGEDFVAEVANDSYLTLVGKPREEFVGNPLFQSIPEAREILEPLAKEILKTGEPIPATEFEIVLKRNGKEETCYFNSMLQPYYESEGIVSGVIAVVHEVTDQVNARKRVEESEQQLRSVIESSYHPIGVYVGEDLRIQFANQALKEGLGKGNDIIGRPYKEVLPELENHEVLERLDSVYKTGKSYHTVNQRLDLVVQGELRPFYFNFSFTPLFNTKGEIYGVVNTGADVTGLANINKEIEAEKERANLAIEIGELGLFEFDYKTNEVKADKRFNDILGFDGSQCKEKYLSVFHPDFLPVRTRSLEQGSLNGSFKYEARINHRNQEMRWVKVQAQMYRNETGEPTRMIGVVQDTTEQNNFADELKKFKILSDYAFDAFILMREDGSFAYLNDLALERWGYTREEALHIRVPDVDPIYQEEKFREAFALAQKQVIHLFETLHKRKNGTIYPVEVSMGSIVLENKPHLFAVARDITERKLAEDTLKQRNEELQRTNNDLDNFIYTASHDLKAPISNIESLLQALLRTLPPESMASERAQQITGMMQDSVDRFKKTISSLTEIVKLQQEVKEEISLVNISEIIQEVILDLESEISSASAQVEIDVKNCPAVHFTEKNLRSVIYNLLSNGIKYRSPERVPHIRIHCDSTPDHQILTVSDNGLGMEKGRTDQLFTMFKRFHDHVEGTGISLYMVKKIVDNAGGHIHVESKLGEGTTFRIYLPH